MHPALFGRADHAHALFEQRVERRTRNRAWDQALLGASAASRVSIDAFGAAVLAACAAQNGQLPLRPAAPCAQ
jgi:hypothetical protein